MDDDGWEIFKGVGYSDSAHVTIYKGGVFVLSARMARAIESDKVTFYYNKKKHQIGIKAAAIDEDGFMPYSVTLAKQTNGHQKIAHGRRFLTAYELEGLVGRFDATIENGMVVIQLPTP